MTRYRYNHDTGEVEEVSSAPAPPRRRWYWDRVYEPSHYFQRVNQVQVNVIRTPKPKPKKKA